MFYQCFTNVSPVFHLWFTSVSPMFHQCFTGVSTVSNHWFTSDLPVFHHCFTNVSPVFQQCFNSVSPAFHQCFMNFFTPVLLNLHDFDHLAPSRSCCTSRNFFDSIEINLPLNFIDNIGRLGSYKSVACIPNLSLLWCLKFFDQNSSAYWQDCPSWTILLEMCAL